MAAESAYTTATDGVQNICHLDTFSLWGHWRKAVRIIGWRLWLNFTVCLPLFNIKLSNDVEVKLKFTSQAGNSLEIFELQDLPIQPRHSQSFVIQVILSKASDCSQEG